jgi:hypothetical protein
MARWLRALTVFPEFLSSIPSNHMVAHNHLSRETDALFRQAVIYAAEHTYIKERKKERKKERERERMQYYTNITDSRTVHLLF